MICIELIEPLFELHLVFGSFPIHLLQYGIHEFPRLLLIKHTVAIRIEFLPHHIDHFLDQSRCHCFLQHLLNLLKIVLCLGFHLSEICHFQHQPLQLLLVHVASLLPIHVFEPAVKAQQ